MNPRVTGIILTLLVAAIFYSSCYFGVRAGFREYAERRDYLHVCQELISAGYAILPADCTKLFREAP